MRKGFAMAMYSAVAAMLMSQGKVFSGRKDSQPFTLVNHIASGPELKLVRVKHGNYFSFHYVRRDKR